MSAGYAGIFLDFYGTLVGGDREAVEAICTDLAASHGLEVSGARLAVEWGKRFFAQIERANGTRFRTLFECERRSLRRTLDAYGVSADPAPYVRRLQQYWRSPQLLPGMLETLASWRLPICLVSNADRHDLRMALDTLGLAFDHVVTSEDARAYKPHPAIFRYALERTGWPAERVLHVGDSLHSDVTGARRCGLRTVWLDRPGRISDMGACQSHYRIELLSQLGAIIAGNGQTSS